MAPQELVLVALLAVVPPLLVLAAWMRLVGLRSEAPLRVLSACGAGGLSFAVAVAVEFVLPAGHTEGESWYRAFIEAGPREELLILLAALAVAPPVRTWNRTSSGITWLLAAAAGFAACENLVYGLNHGASTTFARAFTATPAHLLQGIVVGIGAGRVHRGRDSARGWGALVLGLWLAILCHGAYDFLLLGGGLGRFGLPLFLAGEALIVGLATVLVLRRDQNEDLLELSRVRLFVDARVPGPALREMAQRCSRRAFAPAQRVVSEGDEGQSMYVVTRGQLVVHKGGRDVATVGVGGIVGEVSVLTGTRRSADLLSRGETLLLELPRAALLAAIARTDGLAEALLDAAVRKGYLALPTPESLEEEARRSWADVRVTVALQERVAHLRATPLFAKLSHAALVSLAQHVELEAVLRGRRIVRAGGGSSTLYLLRTGLVSVRREGKELARLGPGQFFGEIGLLTGRQATAEVRAVEACELLTLSWAGLRAIVGVHPEVGLSLLSAVARRSDALRQDGGERPALSAAGRLERLVQSDEVSDLSSSDTLAGFRDAFATQALLDVPSLLALRAAAGRTDVPDWAFGPRGLRRVRDGTLALEEVGLSSAALADALSRAPELLRALASQAIV